MAASFGGFSAYLVGHVIRCSPGGPSYEVRSALGEGGFWNVMRAVGEDGAEVALRLRSPGGAELDQAAAEGTTFLERIRRGDQLQRRRLPYLVPSRGFYDNAVDLDTGIRLWVQALDLYPRGNLDQWARRWNAEERVRLGPWLLKTLVRPLGTLFREEWAHRDWGAHNALLTTEGDRMVAHAADFDSACRPGKSRPLVLVLDKVWPYPDGSPDAGFPEQHRHDLRRAATFTRMLLRGENVDDDAPQGSLGQPENAEGIDPEVHELLGSVQSQEFATADDVIARVDDLLARLPDRYASDWTVAEFEALRARAGTRPPRPVVIPGAPKVPVARTAEPLPTAVPLADESGDAAFTTRPAAGRAATPAAFETRPAAARGATPVGGTRAGASATSVVVKGVHPRRRFAVGAAVIAASAIAAVVFPQCEIPDPLPCSRDDVAAAIEDARSAHRQCATSDNPARRRCQRLTQGDFARPEVKGWLDDLQSSVDAALQCVPRDNEVRRAVAEVGSALYILGGDPSHLDAAWAAASAVPDDAPDGFAADARRVRAHLAAHEALMERRGATAGRPYRSPIPTVHAAWLREAGAWEAEARTAGDPGDHARAARSAGRAKIMQGARDEGIALLAASTRSAREADPQDLSDEGRGTFINLNAQSAGGALCRGEAADDSLPSDPVARTAWQACGYLEIGETAKAAQWFDRAADQLGGTRPRTGGPCPLPPDARVQLRRMAEAVRAGDDVTCTPRVFGLTR